ncbi:protein canopy homolog 2-like [Oscarella lobularis]|uniref:protein canopy homolog 2-like n=1 Tax=Oscarella lobularis TaxID=121494 RepID=UPI003313BFDA
MAQISHLRLVLVGLLASVAIARAKNERKELLCAACQVLIEEVEWAVEDTDPKKKLQVGSFRVDPEGKQRGSYEVPYAGSETHLTELLEEVCEKMTSYALSTDQTTGRKSYVRTSSRRGEPVTLSNISMSGETAEKLKRDCETVVEDLEEEIIDVFKAKEKNPGKILCTSYCSTERDDL